MNIRRLLLAITGALIISMAACSGGNVTVDVGVPSLPSPTSPEPITSRGAITALENVRVNGVRYNTANSTVVVNGRTASVSDLRIGQHVNLEGEINVLSLDGTADLITYNANIIGPVEASDPTLGQLVVIGQRVVVDDRTELGSGIDPMSLGGIAIGETLQISGFTKANGDIAATRIQLDPGATQVQLVGKVGTLDAANMRFTVNGLLVDYSNARVIDLPFGTPTDGIRLITKGNLAAGSLVADELHAIHDLVPGAPYYRINVQGHVTQFNSTSDFHIDGHPITTDWDTDYTGGSVGDIQRDVEMTIEGRISGDGNAILADEITLRRLLLPSTTLTYGFSEFDEIYISSVFDVVVTQAEEYAVEVTIDEDIVNNLIVTQDGNSLYMGLQPGILDVEAIRAHIRLPTLNRIVLEGVIRTTLEEFDQQQLDVAVSGVSLLRSHSSAFANITASILGVCRMDFGDVSPTSTADFEVTGASKATINMAAGSSLSGSLLGTSVLQYYGTNVSVDVTTNLTSFVVKLGETRP